MHYPQTARLTACCIVALACAGRAQAQCEVKSLAPGVLDYGRHTFVDGDRFFIGSDASGVVDVYVRTGAGFRLQQSMEPPIDGLDPDLGPAFAADGDRLVITDENLNFREFGPSGAVFLYNRTTLELEHSILTPSDDPENRFGKSVALDGDTMVVGAIGEDVEGESSAGAVFVYHFDDGEWLLQQAIENPEPEESTIFGASIALADDVLVIGEPGKAGRAHIYHDTGMSWVRSEVLQGDMDNVTFGGRLAFNEAGSTLIVTAPNEADQDGRAYIYDIVNGQAVFEQKLAAENPVGLSPHMGNTLSATTDAQFLLGATADSEAGFEAGAAHLFQRTDGQYQEAEKLLPPPGGGQVFGGGVALSADGDLALIGAPGGEGEAYIYAGLAGIDCDGSGAPDSCEVFAGKAQDVNGNLVPDDCECIGDTNGDAFISSADLNAVLGAFGLTPDPADPTSVPATPLFLPHPADIDNDGDVDTDDLNTLLGAFGEACND